VPLTTRPSGSGKWKPSGRGLSNSRAFWPSTGYPLLPNPRGALPTRPAAPLPYHLCSVPSPMCIQPAPENSGALQLSHLQGVTLAKELSIPPHIRY
jgi:hypothetical protein